jgi:hypothetical protein
LVRGFDLPKLKYATELRVSYACWLAIMNLDRVSVSIAGPPILIRIGG